MYKKITNLIFEALHLKRIKHEGYRFAGISNPDSVAEHSLTAAQIAYILAKLAGADANKCASMLVWHDIAETRIGDLHKIASRYITNKKEIEEDVMKEQFKDLDFKDDIIASFNEYETGSSLEGLIAKDADLLEQAFQSKEYTENGFIKAQDWINNVGKALKTNTAKDIFKQMQNTSFADWWEEAKLKKL